MAYPTVSLLMYSFIHVQVYVYTVHATEPEVLM